MIPLHFDQYSRRAISLHLFRFLANNQKTNSKFEKSFHYFVELVETNPLIHNIKHLEWKWSPAIRLKIVVQTDRIDFWMYSEKDLSNDIWNGIYFSEPHARACLH